MISVPLEPTPEMIAAAHALDAKFDLMGRVSKVEEVWKAMIAAAPSPAGGAVEADLHLRAFPDGLRIYDGKVRMEGPWAWSEASEALSALSARVAALSHPVSGGGEGQGALPAAAQPSVPTEQAETPVVADRGDR